MATLVLTAVGGAIGGPVGAAIGGLLGQRVDRAVLAPRGRQGPRLTDLKVQTSSYGTAIPRVFGTMRVAGCVIWSTDLIETRQDGRAGKGQPVTTSYSYAASFAVALSARRIAGVGRIWADGKLLRGAAGDWKTQTGFRLHHGSEDQAPDPLIASHEADAPAHRGIAYAVFEALQLADFGNRIPSLTFEVIGDATPPRAGDVMRALGEGAIVGAGPDDPVAGYAASGDSVAGAVAALATMTGAWMVPDGAATRIGRATGAPLVLDPDATLREARLPVEGGIVEMDRPNDVCQIALVERHRGTGTVANAFVPGFGYTQDCAMASTVAHDSHHMIVVGTNREDMAIAANRLGEVGGGVVMISKGEELALIEMPIAGLMSDERAEIVAAKAEILSAAMREMGCTLNNAYMQHSLLALVVIPELRISDVGLVDVRTFEKVDVFV